MSTIATPHRLSAALVAVAAMGMAGCPAPADGEPDAGSEGEGEGEGEGEIQDAGPDPDPDTVGLDARPDNPDCVAPDRPVDNTDFTLVQPWPNVVLNNPLFMTQRPGDDVNMYVVERSGRIVRFATNNAAVTTTEVFCDLRDRVETSDSGNSEQGLLGMAFHPDHDNNGELYVSYTALNDNLDCPFSRGFDCAFESRVSRLQTTATGCVPGSEEILLDIDDFAANHNGGHIVFDGDGKLILGMGDGGQANDPARTGQDGASLLGKMIRIDVDTSTDALPYGIPADNPFLGDFDPAQLVRDEVWAVGLRNPWRFSVDRETDELWVGDVGQGRIEEIDLVVPGQNLGWSILEGNECFRGEAACTQGGFTPPVVSYAHQNGRVSVTGGFVYRGQALPSLRGTYVFADFGTKEIFALTTSPQGLITFARKSTMVGVGLASFAEDRDGELYVIDLGGALWRLDPAGPPQPDTFPRRLSQTGCVDDDDATRLGPGVIPYGLNMPFYSDGATKERGLALPDGQTATIQDDGDLTFPIGSVLIKSFRVGGELIETRTLVRHDDGEWAGYSYAWPAGGGSVDGDATLVDTGGTTRVLANGQTWVFPSRAGCLSCHTAAAGRVLGLEVGQLNGGLVYASTGRFANQLFTLGSIGVVSNPVADVASAPRFPPLNLASVDVAERGRTYLHVNCAMCHRPGGGGQSDADMRIQTAFGASNLCNEVPDEGDYGVLDARVFAPGDPARSMVSMRLKRLQSGRMPLLGSTVVDAAGVDVVDRWITSTTSCP
jgi:uncharacterized repeat protein (TIGR03806 family)